MAIKKSELYSHIWKSCNELRGGMDASQYKDYVLVLLFVKYVSDKSKTDKDFLIEVPKGGSFNDMISLKGKPEIGDEINKIIGKLAEANDLKGVIDVADFNDPDKLGKGKDMQDRLSNLISIFETPALNFSKNKAEGDDILGDAYEFLMRHFATESGKSKGQFYTPSEVSKIMAKVIKIHEVKRQDKTVYDPTCGSGSLLLKAADETENGITIYGQENDVATCALAKMNMILHNNPTADIWRGNTISEPHFKNKDGSLKTFDFIVANPPFSTKAWSNGIDPNNDEYERFDGFGVPPDKNGDYAFLLHMIKSLKTTGKAAVILPHGVLFRGNGEGEIRKNIIKRGYIKGIIGLPSNLFFGTGIPACIIVLDKKNSENRKGIFMIDASKGFYKDGNKNRLRSRDIHKIVDVFEKSLELPKYSRIVPITEITNEKNNYNLNIPRYIDTQDDEDLQDIEGHLNGGIPEKDILDLEDYWRVYPNLKNILFAVQRPKYFKLKIDKTKINKTIFENKEFIDYSKKIEKVFDDWKKKQIPILKSIKIRSKPKKLVFELGESILESFSKLELVNKYGIYQHLMNYWSETMQDDVYLLSANGWKLEINITKKKNVETWESDLIPKEVAIGKYFPSEKSVIIKLESELDEISGKIQEIDEENSGDDDVFSDARTDSGKLTIKSVKIRIKEIKDNIKYKDELKSLENCLELLEKEKELKDKIKDLGTQIDVKLLQKYKSLTESEIKILVVEDKWINSLNDLLKSEMTKISQKLAGRIKELAERYEVPLPILQKNVNDLTKQVEGHLKKMGFKW